MRRWALARWWLPWLLDAEALASEVILSGERHQSLLPPTPQKPELPAPLVVERQVELLPIHEQGLEVRARWEVMVVRPSTFSVSLAGAELQVDRLSVDGELLAVKRGPQGDILLDIQLKRSAVIELRGHLRGNPGSGLTVSLLPAGQGTISYPKDFAVTASGQGGAVAIAPGRSLGAAEILTLAPAPVRHASGETLVLGESALGLTVGEAEVRVRGRLRWRIARGELASVSFSVPGAGPDLTVTGPQLASWRRNGDQVEVTLRQPERSLVSLELSYTTSPGQGEQSRLPIPWLRPDGVFRTTSTLQLARDGQLDLVPELPGAVVAAPDDLPEWGQNLVDGLPTATFVGGEGGTLVVYRFTPADSPATIVDVASYTLALTEEGRVLMRAHYAVRNDRGAVLRITPPSYPGNLGLRPIGARVGGELATVACGDLPRGTGNRGCGEWLVPLQKSVETVEGLLSFPVEVLFLGEIGPWDSKKSPSSLRLPSVDAEVAVARATVHLPPGWRNKLAPGRGIVVDEFTEGQGITYGFAVGDVRASQADALFQEAVNAWMSNEFKRADTILDELEQMGASNADISRLRSNLYVIEGESTGSGNQQLERRVLEQARARALEDEEKQKEELKKAEEAYNAGDYAAAEQAYKKALDMGETLAKLRAKEDASQDKLNAEVMEKLQASQQVQKQKVASSMSSRSSEELKRIEAERRAQEEAARRAEMEAARRVEEERRQLALEEARKAAELVKQELDEDEDLGIKTAGEEILRAKMRPSVLPKIPLPSKDAKPDHRGSKGERGDGQVATVTETFEVPYAPAEEVSQILQEVGAGSAIISADPVSNTLTITDSPENLQNYRQILRQLDVSSGRYSFEGIEIAGELVKPEGALIADGDAPEKFDVTAAALAVVIPTQGERVLYQQLLMPPGTIWEVPVLAKRAREARGPRRDR